MDKVIINDCTLYHEDCLEILSFLPSIDVVIADPPYGINLSNHSQGNFRRNEAYNIKGDNNQNNGMAILEWWGNRPLIFFSSPFSPWPGRWRNLVVWNKGEAVGGGGDIKTCLKKTWELIQIAHNKQMNGPRKGSVWYYPMTPKDTKYHICAKPVCLMIELVNRFTAHTDVIFDPFMGSGTTGIACVLEKRKFIGCEIDKEYFDIACKRIKEAYRTRPRLFETVKQKSEAKPQPLF